MPIYASAFFIPTSASIPYILEDVYLKGSYRSVATIAERNAIKTAARKQGALCFVRETNTIYWLPDAVIAGDAAWKPFDVTKYVNFKWTSPLHMDEEHNVYIDEERIIPIITDKENGFMLLASAEGPVWVKYDGLPSTANAEAGMALVLNGVEKTLIWSKIQALPSTEGVDADSALLVDEDGNVFWGPTTGLPSSVGVPDGRGIILVDGKATWGEFSGLPSSDGVPDGYGIKLVDGKAAWGEFEGGGASKPRTTKTIQLGIIPAGTSKTQSETIISSTIALLRVASSQPDCLVQFYPDNSYDDLSNPYSFQSSSLKLEDDGTTVDEEGNITYHRRYSIFSCDKGVDKIFVKVTNTGAVDVNSSVLIEYVPME
jgi:hypothetical protein